VAWPATAASWASSRHAHTSGFATAFRHGIPALHILDVGSLGCTPGLFLGRIANFINGELHGRAVPDQTNPPPWSMKFPQQMHDWLVYGGEGVDLAQSQPQKLAALADAVTHVGVDSQEWRDALEIVNAEPATAQATADWMVRVINALIEQVQAGNEALIETLRPILTAFYPSQLIQAITDGPMLGGVLVLIWLRPRKPGVIGSWFLITYAALRIATEFFREPDQGVALLAGLSRGQVLSLLMLISGFICLAISQRRDVPRLGGLFANPPQAALAAGENRSAH
jgi:phosphatidylglycerol:prolipoprotein diacylglycerol transferase